MDNWCAICLEEVSDGGTTKCGHMFCALCLARWIQQPISKLKCPICKCPIVGFEPHDPSNISAEKDDDVYAAIEQIQSAVKDRKRQADKFREARLELNRQIEEMRAEISKMQEAFTRCENSDVLGFENQLNEWLQSDRNRLIETLMHFELASRKYERLFLETRPVSDEDALVPEHRALFHKLTLAVDRLHILFLNKYDAIQAIVQGVDSAFRSLLELLEGTYLRND